MGVEVGSTIWIKIRKTPAPSISAASCKEGGRDSIKVLTKMMLKGCTMAGMMYTQKVLVKCRLYMVMYMGIRPALKYMETTTMRYQTFRLQRDCWVNIKPRNAEANTVQNVPSTVLAMEISVELSRPFSFNTSM